MTDAVRSDIISNLPKPDVARLDGEVLALAVGALLINMAAFSIVRKLNKGII